MSASGAHAAASPEDATEPHVECGPSGRPLVSYAALQGQLAALREERDELRRENAALVEAVDRMEAELSKGSQETLL